MEVAHLQVPDLVVGDAHGSEDAPLVVLLDDLPALAAKRRVAGVADVLA